MQRKNARARQAAKHDSARPLEQPAVVKTSGPPANAGKPPIDHGPPAKFTYALEAWSAERRSDGWYVAPTVPRAGMPAKWSGPFLDIENACLSIARGLCHELADRHTRHVEHYRITPTDARYGLKPTTQLSAKGKASSVA